MQSCSVGNARTIPGIRVIDAGFNNEPGLLFLLLVWITLSSLTENRHLQCPFFLLEILMGEKKSQYSNITIAHDTAIKARIIVHKTKRQWVEKLPSKYYYM